MANPVTIFEIAGRKEDSICDFYSSLFEWDINQDDDCGNSINTGSDEGIQGHIVQTTEEMPITNHVTFYIQVDDINTSAKKVESHGGKVIMGPMPVPDGEGNFAMFLDPGGNCLGLFQS